MARRTEAGDASGLPIDPRITRLEKLDAQLANTTDKTRQAAIKVEQNKILQDLEDEYQQIAKRFSEVKNTPEVRRRIAGMDEPAVGARRSLDRRQG